MILFYSQSRQCSNEIWKQVRICCFFFSFLIFLLFVADRGRAADPPLGKKWAVVIGINSYKGAIPKLDYATSDAQAMETVLQQQGFEVTTLKNNEATRSNIIKELEDKLVKRVGDLDEVIIFFSGHGVDKKLVDKGKEGFLLTVDTVDKDIDNTAIPMEIIRKISRESPAKHVLFLIDACYGGIAGRSKAFSPYNLPKIELDSKIELKLKALTREPGRWLITAGTEDQQAWEMPKWEQSLFTHFLLRAIDARALADLNDDRIISVRELHLYLEDKVSEEARFNGYTQEPRLWALSDKPGQFVFVYPEKKQPLDKIVEIPRESVEPTVVMPRRRPRSPAPADEVVEGSDFGFF